MTALNEAAAKHANGPGAPAAKRLAADLDKLAKATPQMRQQVETAFTRPLKTALDDLKDLMQAHPVKLAELPPDIVEQWKTPDGRARVEALPKGDPNDNETLRSFARAVLAVEPNAIGGPISILESGHTIVRAFFEAGAWALISIAILLWIVLKRFGDVLLTLVPLLLAGVVTLELCVVLGPAAQLRQHYRAAAAARRRRRVQDLLHHGVAGGSDRPAAVEPDARGVSTARSPPRPRSAACGSRAIRARRAWASCSRFRCSPRSRPRCCSSRC